MAPDLGPIGALTNGHSLLQDVMRQSSTTACWRSECLVQQPAAVAATVRWILSRYSTPGEGGAQLLQLQVPLALHRHKAQSEGLPLMQMIWM
jgi:hypothetical protein